MSAEECARRFRVIRRMGNDPCVRHMGHLTNHLVSWDRTNESVCLSVHFPLCIPLSACFCGNVSMCEHAKNVLASKNRPMEGKDILVSKDTKGDHFQNCCLPVRFVLKICAGDVTQHYCMRRQACPRKCWVSTCPHTYTTKLMSIRHRIQTSSLPWVSEPSTLKSSLGGFNILQQSLLLQP